MKSIQTGFLLKYIDQTYLFQYFTLIVINFTQISYLYLLGDIPANQFTRLRFQYYNFSLNKVMLHLIMFEEYSNE